tara:strand:+ start:344 stop:925 length:582 start_codon:yes stop_codon:yes gene_type:complete
MSLDSNSWNQRYISKNTGWDIGYVSTPLKEYFDQIVDKDQKILIPGCGNAHEAEYLFKKGFKNVFIVDFSNKALENFKSRIKNFPSEHMICNDFFKINGKYDLIIEQTFFCAIQRNKRQKYVSKTHSLLKKDGKLVGLLFDSPMYEDHPPFGGTSQEYKDYFSPFFKFKAFSPSYNSINSRKGKELFINLVKK